MFYHATYSFTVFNALFRFFSYFKVRKYSKFLINTSFTGETRRSAPPPGGAATNYNVAWSEIDGGFYMDGMKVGSLFLVAQLL